MHTYLIKINIYFKINGLYVTVKDNVRFLQNTRDYLESVSMDRVKHIWEDTFLSKLFATLMFALFKTLLIYIVLLFAYRIYNILLNK